MTPECHKTRTTPSLKLSTMGRAPDFIERKPQNLTKFLRRAFNSKSLRYFALLMMVNDMQRTNQSDRSRPRLRLTAIAIGLVAAFLTVGAVSSVTPDGKLVVTLVAALVLGLAGSSLPRGASAEASRSE